MRTIKVMCSGSEQAALLQKYAVVERYSGFVVLEVDDGEAPRLARDHPVEDITDQFLIPVGRKLIDTTRPRVDAQGVTHAHPVYEKARRLAAGPHHYLVQFVGPIKDGWLGRIKRVGGEPRTSWSSFTYVVRVKNEQVLARVCGLPFVRWVGHLSQQARIRVGDALERSLPRSRALLGVYTVEFFDASDMARARRVARTFGVKVLSYNEGARLMVVEVTRAAAGEAAELARLAAIHGVMSIRKHALKRTSADVAAGIMNARVALEPPHSLAGSGEIVAVCDTGLDTGHPDHMHQDFAGRVLAVRSYPIAREYEGRIRNRQANDDGADRRSGHGTHVAGCAVGSGAASRSFADSPVRGLAHKAKLVFQAVEQRVLWASVEDELEYGAFDLAGIPSDLTPLFRYAWDKGARIHSNSWGGGDPGEYDANCQQLDAFVWRHPEFCVLAAAGNEGTDEDGDGRINPMSICSPGTAKNCITVGASESLRPEFKATTYGKRYGDYYPVQPIRDDPMADDPDQVAAFSSRGPTQDLRVKPDVVAPGTFILSTKSRLLPEDSIGDAPAPSLDYFFMNGTSMATPLVAGAAALLREYLRRKVGLRRPSAAMIKACLIAGARRLPRFDKIDPAPGYQERVCDYDQGFGRVDVGAIVARRPGTEVYFRDDTKGLRTGAVDTFHVRVKRTEVPLRVALTYSDYPGAGLVNNLNLMLTDPRGRHHSGNCSPGELVPDTRNNAEVLHILLPLRGKWTLRVIGSNVPHGPQPYALVIRGGVSVRREELS